MATMCKICGVRPAKIHYTEIVNNNMVALDLCLECAEEKGIDVPKSGSYVLGDLVAGLLDTLADSESEKISKVHCTFCGYDYSNFKKIGRFGCPECYNSFDSQLVTLIRQIHGSTQHKGKGPEDLGPKATLRKELIMLKQKLDRAIDREDYEEAATIRDQIRELEKNVRED